jgi:hypothetical protein
MKNPKRSDQRVPSAGAAIAGSGGFEEQCVVFFIKKNTTSSIKPQE